MAVSGLAMPPDQKLFHSASIFERMAELSMGTGFLASTDSRLRRNVLGQGQDLVDLWRLEHAPDAVGVELGEGRADQVLLLDRALLDHVGLERLEEVDLQGREGVVLGDEALE